MYFLCEYKLSIRNNTLFYVHGNNVHDVFVSVIDVRNIISHFLIFFLNHTKNIMLNFFCSVNDNSIYLRGETCGVR